MAEQNVAGFGEQSFTDEQFHELEAIYKYAPIGLALIEKSFRFVRINERLAEINGFSVEQHLGTRVHDIVPSLAAEVENILAKY